MAAANNLAVNMSDSGDLQDKFGDIDTTFSVSESMYIKYSPIILSHNRGPGLLDICKERSGQIESLEFNASGFSHGKVEIVVMLFSEPKVPVC